MSRERRFFGSNHVCRSNSNSTQQFRCDKHRADATMRQHKLIVRQPADNGINANCLAALAQVRQAQTTTVVQAGHRRPLQQTTLVNSKRRILMQTLTITTVEQIPTKAAAAATTTTTTAAVAMKMPTTMKTTKTNGMESLVQLAILAVTLQLLAFLVANARRLHRKRRNATSSSRAH